MFACIWIWFLSERSLGTGESGASIALKKREERLARLKDSGTCEFSSGRGSPKKKGNRLIA